MGYDALMSQVVDRAQPGERPTAGLKIVERSAHPVVSILSYLLLCPCQNEAETLERCIRKARSFIEKRVVAGEIIVADNGSSDGSPEIAERFACTPCARRGTRLR